MRFPTRKVYGQSKISTCPFCGKIAIRKTETGLEVCPAHTKEQLQEIKCTCGSWLEQRAGKFGPYFNCLRCGNINFNKAMEMKALAAVASGTKNVELEKPVEKVKFNEKKEPKETTITSQDVEYFD